MNLDTKLCTDCKMEKSISLFSSAGQGLRLRPQCKSCTNLRESSRIASRRSADGVTPDTRCCSKCNESKPLTSDFFKAGVRCKHGLSTECTVCLGARSLAWSKTDAGKSLRLRLAPRYKDYMTEYAKKYQKANRVQINAYVSAWRKKNIIHCRSLDAAWARKNKAKRAEYRHNRRAAGEFSYSIVPELMKKQSGKCTVCRGLLTKFVEIDHIFPIALGGTNEKFNLQLLCRPCNRSKGAKHPIDFMQARGFLL